MSTFFGDLPLAAHRIDRHQHALDFQHFQQLGDHHDLVRILVRHHLTQAKMVGRHPRTDYVDRHLVVGRLEAMTQRLAVDGHDLPISNFMQRRDPT